MKYLITIISILFCMNGYGQVISNTIDKVKIGIKIGISAKYIQRIDKDTTYWVRIHYQNLKYYYTVDRGSIGIWDQKTLIEFKNCITECLKYTDTKSQNIRFDRKKYSVYVYDTSKSIYFYDKNNKYTSINKKQAIKFLAWLDTIELP